MRKLLVLLAVLGMVALVGCSEDDKPTAPEVANFVGSPACESCHQTIHDNWADSGHPYKLTKVDGEAPVNMFPGFANLPNDVVDPPGTYTWDDISYIIGGYGWKLRFIDNDGYIVTSGAAGDPVQYNYENDTWVTYHTDAEAGTKPYDCGRCHTTGWVADEDFATDETTSDNQDNLPGMQGTFFAGGVHCEACHGPGSLHADDPDGHDMELNSSSSLCGECHMRDSEHHIASSGGFIKHHEQYDEWLHSAHGGMDGPGCNDCHDPHSGVKFDDVAAGIGTTATCESCHTEITTTAHASEATCVDCHMAKASKSAVAVHDYQGDIKTHIWSINTAAVGKDEMFTAAGDFVAEDGEGHASVTLDFACYGCHKDEGGIGGEYSQQSLEALSARAMVMHEVVPDLAFVGSETCSQCHSGNYDMWVESGHPYKLTKIDGTAPTDQFPIFSDYPNDPVDPPVGLAWSDISYTIGGFGWKMRWIDSDGYIVTSGAAGDLVQYNFENDSWVTYHTGDEQGTKPYDCGKCHTTGWVADEDFDTDGTLADNQDGLPGMLGTFFAGGVHCEECHGMGSQHAFSPTEYAMTVDATPQLCGRCHTRDAANHIAASGGFIKHHEQYDEWLHSPHGIASGVGCNDCHDPHASVKFDGDATGVGTTMDCQTCHTGVTFTNHNGFPGCTDCHMPKASKSAVAVHDYQGDIKTHIWSINTAAVGKDDMFNAGGDLVVEDLAGQSSVTLDFACYGCHKDEGGIGGDYSIKSLTELSNRAIGMHTREVSER